ncbi:MAG: type II toxin-antitoxin system RelB/DinJ family antitoxin [Candidatus Electrothrix sp. GW3-4]|uniref:type II toxin-antitoxin system RelB/DinJ family antitoxin n=1 Tax=Candidatus Electrothrix sp. GW3-4 TaxID=3126740 RepID=UPI0030D18B83
MCLRNDDNAQAGVIIRHSAFGRGRIPVSALFIRHPGMFQQGRHRGLPLRIHGVSNNSPCHTTRTSNTAVPSACDVTICTGSLICSLASVLHMCYAKATMKTATIHARIEPDTKEKAEKVLRKLGLTPTEAIRIFYRQICLGNGLPFPVEIPNRRTAETLEKSQRGEEVEEFDSLDDMFDTWPL